MNIKQPYADVTANITKELEAGRLARAKPWKRTRCG
jgi:antirestriction protein ArdC